MNVINIFFTIFQAELYLIVLFTINYVQEELLAQSHLQKGQEDLSEICQSMRVQRSFRG